MPLQDQLDRITQNTRALVQAERLAVSEAATAALFQTGIEDRIAPVGSIAPTFTLADALTGKPVHLADVLSLGPVVLKFFRGRWCPYCVTELEIWRDLYADVRRRGAFLLAISPQTPRQNDFTLQQHELPFPILSDPGAQVSHAYGLAHTIPVPLRNYYRSILVNIPFANAGLTYDTATEASWTLPLPATFLVRQDGTIAFAEAHADFHVRPEPADVLALL
ncbi:Peroxiredoxin [Granulicella pectinivorans]|uniref:thioredoxin-dependent peroxiredoxin n=1 Tax=Granulicella pectinivorans TaxID=474950 RepID=A0A1I6MEP3_9BACT|nr:peroxiredoxin-like family protein [Granulicella pectinivorans]SFS14093.1 Peroxiredoxin [Granulicella pectinivorans]